MKSQFVIIVAGGRGSRMQSDLPKQYLDLAGKTVLYRTVKAFLDMDCFEGVRVIIHPDDLKLYHQAIEDLVLLSPVNGGSTRQESVRNGLESLTDFDPDVVLIHDAARPFIDKAVIQEVLDNIKEKQGVVPGLAVADTLRKVQNKLCEGTVDRSSLWRMQTPQGFIFDEILSAHRELADQTLTDDTSLYEKLGKDVVLVQGHEKNFKITTGEDLVRAKKEFDMTYEFRTGQGFDVHRFSEGSEVFLCGVSIPHTHSLKGHSDADVALHAITDALLGAIAEGDIGIHFPPSDPQWKGAPSYKFLRYAKELAQKKFAKITNVDVTIICEKPKVGPHREAMRLSLASILEVDLDRISVKGTTTEKLGFTGRGEGIASQAVVTVRLPSEE